MDIDEKKIIWNPFSKAYLNDPEAHFRELRANNPIQKSILGAFVFFNYSEVNEIIKSPDFDVLEISKVFAEREGYIFNESSACPHLATSTSKWPMHLNGDEHKCVRNLIGNALNKIDLNQVLPKALDELFALYNREDKINLPDFTAHFQFLIIRAIFGIKDSVSFEKLRMFSRMLTKIQDSTTPKQIHQEVNEWLEWGTDVFKESDFYTDIFTTQEEFGFDLSEKDLYSILIVSMAATFETTKESLAYALLQVLQDKKRGDSILEASGKKIRQFNEEILRLFSAAQYTLRINKIEKTIGEMNIPKGSRIMLCLASANRDEAVFERPDEIVLDRSAPHMAFGRGIHFCLGSQIARQELAFALKPMLVFLREKGLTRVGEVKMAKQIFMRSYEEVILSKG